MAEIIDERQLGANEEVGSLEELGKAPPPEPAKEQPTEEEIPDKYKGKGLKDIVRMHQEAEKALGRQSGEVGELRKIVDEFISKQTELTTKKQEPASEIDFFVDPKAAVEQAIANHPALKEVKTLTVQQRQAAAQAELTRRHPDVANILSDQAFLDWSVKTPVRQSLLVRADKEYDVEAADELISLWKERKSFAAQAAVDAKTDRKAAVNAAATGGTGSSEPVSTKKKYRRADIIKLMTDDPARYEALMPEIRAAYAEGRII